MKCFMYKDEILKIYLLFLPLTLFVSVSTCHLLSMMHLKERVIGHDLLSVASFSLLRKLSWLS